MLSFVPLHLSVLERESTFKLWVLEWAQHLGRQNPVEFLQPEDWVERGHDIIGYRKNLDGVTMPKYKSGIFVWTPPPAAALWALEELRQARHKRQASTHIFIVPQLLKQEWNRQLYKEADLIIHIPIGHPHWQKSNHESLTLAICFPFMNRAPWQL